MKKVNFCHFLSLILWCVNVCTALASGVPTSQAWFAMYLCDTYVCVCIYIYIYIYTHTHILFFFAFVCLVMCPRRARGRDECISRGWGRWVSSALAMAGWEEPGRVAGWQPVGRAWDDEAPHLKKTYEKWLTLLPPDIRGESFQIRGPPGSYGPPTHIEAIFRDAFFLFSRNNLI